MEWEWGGREWDKEGSRGRWRRGVEEERRKGGGQEDKRRENEGRVEERDGMGEGRMRRTLRQILGRLSQALPLKGGTSRIYYT